MAQNLKKLRDKLLLIGVALIAALGIVACGGGGGSSAPAGGETVTLNSVLSGNQISALSGGPIVTNAGGSGTLTLNAARTAIDFTLNAGALDTFNSPVIVGAHIHARDPGLDNGPIIFDFLPAAVPNPLVLSGTLTAADLIPRPNVPDFPTAVAALLNGTTYFQVHTDGLTGGHPGGEIRGEIGTQTLTAILTADQVTQVVPNLNVAGTGTVAINRTQDTASVSLSVTGLSSTIQGAHIHFGAVGVNGPIIFNFVLPSTDPATPLAINVVLTAANLIAVLNVPDFPAAVDALLSGNTYFQVHTANNPGGEVRGQILPVR